MMREGKGTGVIFMAKEGKPARFGKKRSRILYQIAALIVVLLVIAGLVIFFVIDNAFDRLIEKSTDKLVEEEAKTINNALEYLAEGMVEGVAGDIAASDPQELQQIFLTSFQNKELNELQEAAITMLKELVDTGVLGVELIIEATLPMPPVLEERRL